MSPGRVEPKAALAAEVWRLLLGYFLANKDRHAAMAADLDLTLAEMRALLSLEPETGQPMGSLAERWRCDASNVTWVVDRLEDRGFVERRAVPGDRRVKKVAMTPLGEKTRNELLERVHQPPEELLALTRTELSALRQGLGKLVPPASTG